MGYFYVLGTVFFTVYGQLVIKWRINEYGALPPGYFDKVAFLAQLLLDPWIFSGFVSAFVASFFWMAAMTKFEVSHAYPVIIGGLAILTSIFAIALLKETVSVSKILGISLIVAGVIFLGKGQ